jgi:hypothetical protein
LAESLQGANRVVLETAERGARKLALQCVGRAVARAMVRRR